MKEFSDIVNGKYFYDIVLGKNNEGNYCCTNITEADVFLSIVPKLKNIYETEVPVVLDQEMSNETSPIAIKFMKDGICSALYNREKIFVHYVKLTPFSDPSPIKTLAHNVLKIYDIGFLDNIYKITNKTLNLRKYLKHEENN